MARSLARQRRPARRFFFSSKEKAVQKTQDEDAQPRDVDIKTMPNLRHLIERVREQNALKGTRSTTQVRCSRRSRRKTRASLPCASSWTTSCSSRTIPTSTKATSTSRPGRPCSHRDHDFFLELPEFDTSVYVYKRPHLDDLMKFLETEVEAVLFTTAHAAYVDRIMAKVDPEKKVFRHRVCQEGCDRVEDGEEEVDTLVKDLGLLGRDLGRVVLVDSKPFSFWSHPDNAYPLKEYRGGVLDEPDLGLLLDSLRELKTAADVRPLLAQRFFVRDALREANLL